MHLKRFLIALLSIVALQARGIDFLATNTYHVAKDQIVADEHWVLAALVETEGTFKNDLFITSGNELKLGGTFEGNVWGAASMGATMDGRCERNVRLTGKTVRIDGPVGGNVMALAETIIIGTNANINGNVKLFATSIIQEGLIRGDASISSARVVTLGGTIEGNTTLIAPDVLFSRDTKILGNLTYTANKELFPAEGIVAGTLLRTEPRTEPLFSISRLTSRALWFFAAFLAGVPFIALFPMTTAMASQLVRKSPWKCLLIGFLASGALPIIGIMSVSSIIGVPLGALILASWGVMLYLSRIIMGLVLGSLILRSLGNSLSRVLLAMAIGLALIYFTTIIPSIGMPVQMTVIWLGMGSLILSLLEKRRLIIQVPQSLKKLEELRNEQYNPEEE